jgi:hypothetical protein
MIPVFMMLGAVTWALGWRLIKEPQFIHLWDLDDDDEDEMVDLESEEFHDD